MNPTVWDRPSIQAAKQALEGWGLVQRARALTHDPTYISKPDDAIGAGARGKPSNIPDIALVALEVDSLIDSYPTPGNRLVRNVLLNIYSDSVNEYEDEMGIYHRNYLDRLDELFCPVAEDIATKLALTQSDLKMIYQRVHRRFVEKLARSLRPRREAA